MGVIFILLSLAWFFANIEELRVFDIVYTVVFFLTGIFNMTNSFGLEKIVLQYADQLLRIRRLDRFRTRNLLIRDIECIYLKKDRINIGLKGRKPFTIRLDYLETAGKRDIYQFFIDLGREKGINISRYDQDKGI
jgi:hypothetical protein